LRFYSPWQGNTIIITCAGERHSSYDNFITDLISATALTMSPPISAMEQIQMDNSLLATRQRIKNDKRGVAASGSIRKTSMTIAATQ